MPSARFGLPEHLDLAARLTPSSRGGATDGVSTPFQSNPVRGDHRLPVSEQYGLCHGFPERGAIPCRPYARRSDL